MCGIAGKLNIDGSSPDQGLLRRMAASLALRDPDDEGFYFDDHIGLGHRRLSIIDLESGSQPLANEDGSVWVISRGFFRHQYVKHMLDQHSRLECFHGYRIWVLFMFEHWQREFMDN